VRKGKERKGRGKKGGAPSPVLLFPYVRRELGVREKVRGECFAAVPFCSRRGREKNQKKKGREKTPVSSSPRLPERKKREDSKKRGRKASTLVPSLRREREGKKREKGGSLSSLLAARRRRKKFKKEREKNNGGGGKSYLSLYVSQAAPWEKSFGERKERRGETVSIFYFVWGAEEKISEKERVEEASPLPSLSNRGKASHITCFSSLLSSFPVVIQDRERKKSLRKKGREGKKTQLSSPIFSLSCLGRGGGEKKGVRKATSPPSLPSSRPESRTEKKKLELALPPLLRFPAQSMKGGERNVERKKGKGGVLSCLPLHCRQQKKKKEGKEEPASRGLPSLCVTGGKGEREKLR